MRWLYLLLVALVAFAVPSRRAGPCSPTRCSPTRARSPRTRRSPRSCAAWCARTSRSTTSDAPLARDLRVLVRERLQAGDSDRRCSISWSRAMASSFCCARGSRRTPHCCGLARRQCCSWERAAFSCSHAATEPISVAQRKSRRDLRRRKRAGYRRFCATVSNEAVSTWNELVSLQQYLRSAISGLTKPRGAALVLN